MKIIDRIIIIFLSIILIAVSALLVAISLQLVTMEQVCDLLMDFDTESIIFIVAALLIALVLIVLCLKLIFSRNRKPVVPKTLVKASEFGEVMITISAIDFMAQRKAKEQRAVKDVKSRVIIAEEGVNIVMDLTVLPDTVVPELTQTIQENVKSYVQEYAGISVENVKILVGKIYTPKIEQ